MKHIIDPRPLLEGAPPSSPLWALADAFDAAANGMENPEADARLQAATETRFRPWKAAIAALKALYADDRRSCREAAASIDPDSPPAVLAPLFRAWTLSTAADRSLAMEKELAGAETAVAELFGRLIVDAHPLGIQADQAEEALRQGMLDHFERSAARILRELHANRNVDGPSLALRYAARCLALLSEEGQEEADFYSVIVRALGRADGFLAIGLSLVERDDCAAAAAFRGALEAGDGVFLAGPLRSLVAQAADILDGSEPLPKGAAVRALRPACEDRETLQLELFA